MAAEEGCLTLNGAQIDAGSVIVTPSVQPTGGKAESRRTYNVRGTPRVRAKALPVTLEGANLKIHVGRCKADDQVFWTSYS